MRSFTTPSDIELIERARQGNDAAFRVLVQRHEQQVRSIIIGMLGNTAESDDVAQEVFVRFYRSLGDFRGEAALSTYLSRIAINLSLNEIKRRDNRYKRFAMLQGYELQAEQTDNCVDPERHDIRDAVQKALQMLEPDFRIVIILRLIDGYSVKETAEMLELPQGTVASRLARAQEKMKDILKKWNIA
ncbi:MAG TPA: sigma-70 family RNA polymerase sigma factor [Saprospiraceae bacterium]|nr:sigma-70 family RNA polymerase sigma factor [Saprospiraceae bacterium]HMP23555.1 sigma-70 family RNA polymerase sigma factor [Saprospiraceae bacterium]